MLFRMSVKKGRRAMPCHSIIHAFCLLTLAFGSTLALAGEKPLTLSKALSRAMAQNPGLQVFDFRLQGLDGRRITADQNPALEAAWKWKTSSAATICEGSTGRSTPCPCHRSSNLAASVRPASAS